VFLTLASCCGPETPSNPGDVLFWAIVGLCCALLLLGPALSVFIALRKRGSAPWRRPGVVAPAALAVLALALAQQAWSAYSALRVTGPGMSADADWYAQHDAAARLFTTLGTFLAAGTLLTLGIGAAFLLIERD
jgi:hypothetical protein